MEKKEKDFLRDDQILPACYRYASLYSSYNIPFNELLNVGYINCKQLDNPKNVGKWAKYTIIHYVQKNTKKHDNRLKDASCIMMGISTEDDQIIDFDVVDDLYNEPMVSCELNESLRCLISSVCSSKEQALLAMRFWQNMPVKDIAQQIGLRPQTVCWHLKNILTKLREAYEDKL